MNYSFLIILVSVAFLHFGTLFLTGFDYTPPEREEKIIKINDLRTVGEDKGKKHTFAMSSSINPTPIAKSQPGTEKAITSIPDQKNQKPGPRKYQDVIKGNEIPQLLSNPQLNLSQIKDSELVISFDVPEGVKEDLLNSIEQVFYSFRKRTYIQYLNSLYKNLIDYERKYPRFRQDIMKERVTLQSDVTFDEQGNILRIKSRQWSDNQRLQDFFDQTISDLVSIPNPPKAFLNESKEIRITFALTLISN